MTAPILIVQVRPACPEEAVSRRLQGSVAIEMIVRRDGVPDAVCVVRPIDRGPLDQEAARVVRQWRFHPGRLHGVAVDVLVTVIVDFALY